ncbi:hypothetical protein ACHAPO_006822 [Fusarium lateritium]
MASLTMTNVLQGWHEAFQWQWSAAMTLVGFVMANTQHSLAPAARRSIQLAVSVLDMFAPSFDAAAKAAIIVRTLHTNIESVMTQFEAQTDHFVGTINEKPLLDRAIPSQEDVDEGVPNQFDGVGNDFDLLDMAMNVDFWAELDMLLPGGFGSNTIVSSQS